MEKPKNCVLSDRDYSFLESSCNNRLRTKIVGRVTKGFIGYNYKKRWSKDFDMNRYICSNCPYKFYECPNSKIVKVEGEIFNISNSCVKFLSTNIVHCKKCSKESAKIIYSSILDDVPVYILECSECGEKFWKYKSITDSKYNISNELAEDDKEKKIYKPSEEEMPLIVNKIFKKMKKFIRAIEEREEAKEDDTTLSLAFLAAMKKFAK